MYSFTGMVLTPWAILLLAVNDLSAIYSQVTFLTFAKVALFGAGWVRLAKGPAKTDHPQCWPFVLQSARPNKSSSMLAACPVRSGGLRCCGGFAAGVCRGWAV